MAERARLAVNQFMVPDLRLDEVVAWCRTHDVDGLGVLRATVAEFGPAATAAVLGARGVTPTSVCVAMGLIDADPDLQAARMRDARGALDDATELGVPLVVVVGGPMAGLRLAEARCRVAEQLAGLAGRAAEIGGRILIEPLHPVLVQLSAVTTLSAAAELAAAHPAVGLVLDTWHVWTEPGLPETITAAARDLDVVHLADWSATPDGDDRELPGDGLIDLVDLVTRVDDAGFDGWWEIEVISRRLRHRHGGAGLLERALTGTRRLLATAGVDRTHEGLITT